MTIGEASCKRILQLCKTNEITLNGLSTTCGITQSTLNNIEKAVFYPMSYLLTIFI